MTMTLLLGCGGGAQVFAAPGVGAPCAYGEVFRAPPAPFGQRPFDCVAPLPPPFSFAGTCPAFRRTSNPGSSTSSVSYTIASRRLAAVTLVPFGKSVALPA